MDWNRYKKYQMESDRLYAESARISERRRDLSWAWRRAADSGNSSAAKQYRAGIRAQDEKILENCRDRRRLEAKYSDLFKK